MKKIVGKIAMILVLIILANSFISCFTYGAIVNSEPIWLILTIPMDVGFFIFELLGLAMGMDIFEMGDALFSDASGVMDSQVYLADAEYDAFREKIYSLSETELASLKQTLNSIPETERISSIERLTSISETKRVSLARAINSLPESVIVSSIERISSLPEAELVSLQRTFNSSSEAELDSLIEELVSLHETDNIATAAIIPRTGLFM